MSVDQAREEWQAAGDYDSACRLIRAQAARIAQIERELVDERDNNEGEYQSRLDAERKARVLTLRVAELENELAAEKALADQIGAQLKIAESALSDIGDAEREDGDDLKWCERRAAKAIPSTREALAAHRKARGL